MKTKLNSILVKEIKSRIKHYDNAALLNATLTLAHGDDYEGEFTIAGEYEFELLQKELNKRLKKIGFLNNSINHKSGDLEEHFGLISL